MSREALTINVAIGIIINSQNEVLIALRPSYVDQGGLWEFPGGKIEEAEDSYQALCRELNEEINIKVKAAEWLMEINHADDNYAVILHVWQITEFTGVPLGLEGQQVRWVPLDEIAEFSFPATNQPIINHLTLTLNLR